MFFSNFDIHNWHRVLTFEMDMDLKAQQRLADVFFAVTKAKAVIEREA
jgi:hypothetical protein